MHEGVGDWKNFISGIAEHLRRPWLGVEFAKPSNGLWHIARHGWIHEVTNFEGKLRSTLAVFLVLTRLESMDEIDRL
jgi:hypothetical protein